jgi:apolipoprotein N-acyltransferase
MSTRVEKINLLLEKLLLVTSGSFALAIPFLVPALSLLHFLALVPWVVLFIHPRYRANSTWVWLGSLIFLIAALRPFVAYHIALPVILALLNFLPIIVFPLLIKRFPRLPLALSVPAAWVITEWIRVWLSARQLQMYFLGSSQFQWTKLIQIADLGGVYAVSFVVASVSGLVADFLIPRQQRLRSAIAVVVIFIATLTYGFIRDNRAAIISGPSIAVVQPRQSRSAPLSALDDFTRRSIWPLQAEMIVWPENAISEELTERPDDQLRLARLARYLRSYLLVGSRGSAYLLSPEGKPVNRYEKIRAMFWSDAGALQALLLPNLRGSEEKATIFELPLKSGVVRFAAPIGLEITDLKLWRGAARDGAEFLVNITTEGKVGRSVYSHLLALSAFQAVQNRMGVIRAANDGMSAFVDPNGRVRAVASDHDRAVLVQKITGDRRHGTTFYARFGDVFVLACGIAVAIALIVQRVRRASPGALVIQEELHASNHP